MVILLHVLVALAYAGLAWHFWRTRWARASDSRIMPWERIAIVAPLTLHSWLLYSELFLASELRFGFGFALSAMLWLTVLIYWIESLFLELVGMQALVLGIAALCAPLPAWFPGLLVPPAAQSLEFRVHTAVALLAYSLFTMAALHALLMAILERRLHGHVGGGTFSGPIPALPPLLSMEIMTFRLLALGFILLTLTLITGVTYSEAIYGQAMKFNHMTLFALVSWLIFAALLAGRHFYGWRGKIALRWTLAGFLALLLAYVGSRFVLEVILKRLLV
jgi:ABC-type uncharacterized transport system permease subunit